MISQTPRKGIQHRLIRVFAMQAALVSIATALGVFAAYKIAEDILVKEALVSEAEHYLELVDQYGNYPLPNTKNMRGFRADISDLNSLPSELRDLDVGFGRHEFEGKSPLILVTEQNDERLYLIFKEEQVSRLALFFGVAPLTVVLILIYSASWFTFRQSQRIISPVVQLAKVVEETDVTDSQALHHALQPFHEIDADVDTLTTALEHFTFRLQSFVERERNFTRDASHELRTPLAVLKGSMDVLAQMETLSEKGNTVTRRMRETIQDMESLIETLLLLAREDNSQIESVIVKINELIPAVAHQTQTALQNQTPITINNNATTEVTAPNKVLSILFTNLLKNALLHGQGAPVTITINKSSVVIEDQGPGMSAEHLAKVFQPFYRRQSDGQGHGLGLAIVKRLCDRFSWPIEITSKEGKGTTVTVNFPSTHVG